MSQKLKGSVGTRTILLILGLTKLTRRVLKRNGTRALNKQLYSWNGTKRNYNLICTIEHVSNVTELKETRADGFPKLI